MDQAAVMLRHLAAIAVMTSPVLSQPVTPVHSTDPARCPNCKTWNEDRAPSRIFGNVYYVGTQGLSSILIASPAGHVLIDGGLPESAPRIADHVEAIGFHLKDVKVILNSHAHFDHAGGISWLQRASGARVLASPESAPVLRTGQDPESDPQHGLGVDYLPSARIETVHDGDSVRVGELILVAHAMGGHMPGGTGWSWRSCEGAECLDFLYADSQTAISNDSFLFSKNPDALAAFERGFRFLETTSCDVLLTPHPGASSMFERMAGRMRLRDRSACARLAVNGRRALAARLAREKGR
jgi:metallo-beta-lactamase class B